MPTSTRQKILISWVDYRHDFTEPNTSTPSMQGINYETHQYWYDTHQYDFHLLISWNSGEPKHERATKNLLGLLQENFPSHTIKLHECSFTDPLNLPIIEHKMQELLSEYHADHLDILINTGYQMMQYAWLLCHKYLQYDTHLLQVRKREYSDNQRPNPEEIIIDESKGARALLIQSYAINNPVATFEGNILTPTLQRVYNRARTAALSDEPVLIIGESGTGKELLAQFIHRQRDDRKDNYYAVNCASFTDELLRSELFGHTKNAFTGAGDKDSKGFFEQADGGTLFLDEIGDTSPYIQQSLLRVTQSGVFYPVGSQNEKYTKVKLIAATNRDIAPGQGQEHFRSDLYYRLSVLMLKMPSWTDYPAKEQKKLLEEMLHKVAIESQAELLPLTSEAKKYLLKMPMPGNLRQLHNLIKRLYIFCADMPQVTLSILKSELNEQPANALEIPPPQSSIQEVEAWHIQRSLDCNKGNITHTSNDLGITPVTLRGKMKKYGF